jgi:GNAT superfamily N-acetyltransferase
LTFCSVRGSVMSANAHAIRILTAGDSHVYRDLRSRALRSSSGYFVADVDALLQRSEEAWEQEFLNASLTAIAAFQAERAIALTMLVVAESDPSGKTVISTGSYVEPEFRRTGVFGELAWFALRLCRERGFAKLLASHKAGNVAVQTIMQGMGFVIMDQKEARWADGSVGDEVRYSLDLSAAPWQRG